MAALKKIVVGIDFSAKSIIALRQAARIAAAERGELHLIHVIDLYLIDDLRRATHLPEERLRTDLRDTAHKKLEALALDIKSVSPVADSLVAFGDPATEVLRRAQNLHADLLVLGYQGHADQGESAGPLATRAVRKAASKVMLVKQTVAQPFKCVASLLDFSPTSLDAVKHAAELAAFDGAELHVAHFATPLMYYAQFPFEGMPTPPSFQPEYTNTLKEEMRQFLKPVIAQFPSLKLRQHCIEVADRLKPSVTSFLRDIKADLVVLGTRGRTGAKVFLMGTVAEYVIMHSPCSVLAVKPADFEFKI